MGLQTNTQDPYAKGFGDLEIDLGGEIFTSVAKVSYGMPLQEGWVRGTKKRPQKRTAGQLDPGAGELEFEEVDESQRLIAAIGNAWRMKTFTSVLTFHRPGQPSVRFEFFECRILDEKGDHSSGTDSAKETLPFSYSDYSRNGLKPTDE